MGSIMARKQSKTSAQREQWEAQQISRASYYTASIYFDGKHHTRNCQTREEAEEVGRQMNSIVQTRRASVYAITPEGASFFVCNPT